MVSNQLQIVTLGVHTISMIISWMNEKHNSMGFLLSKRQASWNLQYHANLHLLIWSPFLSIFSYHLGVYNESTTILDTNVALVFGNIYNQYRWGLYIMHEPSYIRKTVPISIWLRKMVTQLGHTKIWKPWHAHQISSFDMYDKFDIHG